MPFADGDSLLVPILFQVMFYTLPPSPFHLQSFQKDFPTITLCKSPRSLSKPNGFETTLLLSQDVG